MWARLLSASTVITVVVFAAPVSLAGSSSASCAYREAGPPGAVGNFVQVDNYFDLTVARVGTEVRFYDAAPLDCDGPTPTTSNIDSIRVRQAARNGQLSLDQGAKVFSDSVLRGTGPLSPGASPEPSGPEIEVIVSRTPQQRSDVLIIGRESANSIILGENHAGTVGVNLNAHADGASPDADVVWPRGECRSDCIDVFGGAKNDLLSGRGAFPGFPNPVGDPPITHASPRGPNLALHLNGGAGDDRLFGGSSYDILLAGTGDDLMRAGRSNDILFFGEGGRDTAFGGPGVDRIRPTAILPEIDTGADRLFGGTGDDRIKSAANREADFVNCGRGEDAVESNPADHKVGCEHKWSAPF
jgi:Ca2+-binding RTX toxin-like protein